MATAEEIKKKVVEEIEKIRPRLQMDGGDVELVSIDDGVVKVKMEGACRGCPMSTLTLQMGIERTIKNAVPEIKSVEAINLIMPGGFLDRLRKIEEEEEKEEKKEKKDKK